MTPPLPERSRTQALSAIARMLSSADSVRDELADDIREQISGDAYLTDEKLELAIYRMLKDILR